MDDTIIVNGKTYVAEKPSGTRVVLVADRGWIFAGDIMRNGGRIKLSRAVHVLGWDSIGFAGLVADTDPAKNPKIRLKKCADVDMPEEAELFICAVGESWGL